VTYLWFVNPEQYSGTAKGRQSIAMIFLLSHEKELSGWVHYKRIKILKP